MVRALASLQCAPVSIPGLDAICGLHEFVVGSRPCSKSFFFGYSDFPLSSNANSTNLIVLWAKYIETKKSDFFNVVSNSPAPR